MEEKKSVEKSKYTFSIIIPVFNVERYLSECMNSVLSQTFNDYEIVLVDDGSDDGSEKMCDEYAMKYHNVTVFHKENGGQSSARNKGVDLIRGEYFIFVDSDDYISRNTLEMFSDIISKDGLIDVILSECMYNIEPDGKILDIQSHFKSEEFEGVSGQQAILQMGMEWSPCGKCYRTSYWKDHNFRFMEGRISEDFQLIDRVTLDAKRVAMIPGHYYYRWKIPSSTMHVNYKKLVEDTLFVLIDWEKYLLCRSFEKHLDEIIRQRLADMLEHTVMGNAFFVEKTYRKKVIDDIANCAYMIKYDTSVSGRLIQFFISVFGINNTCYILNLIKRYRKRRQSFV